MERDHQPDILTTIPTNELRELADSILDEQLANHNVLVRVMAELKIRGVNI